MVCSLSRRLGCSFLTIGAAALLAGCDASADANTDLAALAASLVDTTPTDCETPTVADAGADFAATDPDGGGYAYVYLDARASVPDESIFVYTWFEGDRALAAGRYILVRLAVGTHNLSLRVEDACGRFASDTVTVVVNPSPNAAAALASR